MYGKKWKKSLKSIAKIWKYNYNKHCNRKVNATK